jgi:hypothetical protein
MKPLILWGVCWALLHPILWGEVVTPLPPSEVRREVGGLGRSSNLDFEGNASFPDTVLRRALTRDIDYVLASHSAEPLDQLLVMIAERLRLGYRHSGFPEAKATATHRITGDHESILVSISEGPRYRQGAIRVEGAAGIDSAQLVNGLQKTDGGKAAVSYAGRIRTLMASYEMDLPPSDSAEPADSRTQAADFVSGKAGEPSTTQPSFTYLEKLVSSKADPAFWFPGEPLAFGDDDQLPMVGEVIILLAEQGRPLAKVTTRHDLRADGMADLVIHIDDAGPVATVGTVTVEGNVTNTAEEIIRLSGLATGQAATPSRLDEVQLALWRCGRFFPFAIDLRPHTTGDTEVDIHIRVRELEGIPPLSAPADPGQQVVLRFLDWLNSGMPGQELLLERQDPAVGGMIFGWAPPDCMLVNFTPPKNPTAVSAFMSEEGASIALQRAGRTHSARIKGFVQKLGGSFHIIPTNEEGSELAIAAAIGFSTKDSGGFFHADLMITPAYAFLKPDEIRTTADRVIISPAVIPYSIELDAATARPVALTRGDVHCKIVTARGAVRKRQKQLEAELASQAADSSATGWSDAIAGLMVAWGGAGEESPFTEPVIERVRKSARLIDLMAKPEILGALKKGYASFTAGMASTSDFTVPVTAGQEKSGTTLALLLGFGYLGLVEEYLPEAEWTGTFAREMMFILGGKTQHSAKVMNSLLADPAIGPCGSFACAELLEEIDPVTARRFRMKARAQCNAGAFRKDWRLLADSSGPVGRGFNRCLETISSFSVEDEATAIELLPRDMTAWLHAFVGKLRQHESGKPWSDSIAPQMDRLWDDILGVRMRNDLDRRLPPPVDPAEVAATIDDVPVPRHVVQVLEQQRLAPLLALSISGLDASRPWTRDPALAGAIRMIMVRNSMQQAGRYPSEKTIEEFLTQRFPHLAGKPDDDWIRLTGLNRANFGAWAALVGSTQQLLVDLQTNHVDPPDDVALRNYYEARATIYGRSVDTDMILIRSHEGTPVEVGRCFQRAEQLAELLGTGKPATDLEASGELGKEPAAEAFSRLNASLDSYQYSVMKAIAPLKAGEVSKPLEVGGGVAVIVLRATRQAEPPDFEGVKESVLEHWRAEDVANRARQWFEEHEAAANIQLLEAPRDAPASK